MNNQQDIANFSEDENESPATDKYSQELNKITHSVNDAVTKQGQAATGQDTFKNPIGPDDDSEEALEDELEDDADEGSGDVSQEEMEDLDEAASRMPDEEDEFLDDASLDDDDFDGTPLNESDDPLGEDLDITDEDADANQYDENQ
ncbi:MAG TPA: hypothetical protein VL053_03495 [Arachidicoccus sp.]|nr:hypothetical protein [Arachidicoccus sp.]